MRFNSTLPFLRLLLLATIKALNVKKMKIRYMAKSVAWQAGMQRFFGENKFEAMIQKGMKL